MSTLKQRFAELQAGKPEITQADLSRATGAKPPSVNAWFTGETKSMKPGTAAKAAALYGVDPLWLATGEGYKKSAAEVAAQFGTTQRDSEQNHDPGLANSSQAAINNIASLRPILVWEHPDDLPTGDYVLIPRLDVHLSAGNGCQQVEIELVKDTPQAFRAQWIRELRIKPEKLASMRAKGDSMEPRIFDGDAVVVDTGDTTVVDGKVYAVWYDGGERIKRLYHLPGHGLRITSDNANRYPGIDLTEDQSQHVRVIGRVRHVSSTQGL